MPCQLFDRFLYLHWRQLLISFIKVSINPESKSRATNTKVLSELIKLHGKKSLGCKLPAYDGRKSLYTAGSLPFESEEFVVTLVDPEKKDKERAEREYKITIRIAGRTDLFHLQQFLAGRQRDMPQETIQVLDVVLRESPSWNYVTVSRSFFSNTFGHRGDIGEGLECWRGYYQSLLPTQMGLSLNIDISATSFFKPVTVIQFVQEFLVPRPLTDRDRVKIKKALRGVRVETNHQQDQIRRYKITGITPIPMSQLIFPVDERGTRMTVVQYFMERYNYRLQYTSWPCLQSGSDSRPVYLPMEACKIVEGQRYSKKLNDKQATNILRATCQRPQQREQSIREMVLHNKYAEDKLAQEFGIKVCSDLVSVPARVLPPPMLKYHDSGREKTCAPNVGQWNMINKKMINGGTIDKWACISFSRMRPEEVHRFCCDLVQMCNATGMAFCPRPLLDIRTATPNNIENALRDLNRRTSEIIGQQEKGKQLQLLIVILPEISGSYGKIKKACETDLGIVSQCCLPRHASGPNKQYLENVALKINVKAGGRNTVLERAFVRNGIPFVSEVPTIIFGADVTPPPPGEDSASSIAAVVASMDWPEITKYRGLVSAQPHRQEIIEDLFSVIKDPHRGTTVNVGMIRELLIAFRRKTGRRTERIIFDRDGVTEGQFSHVLLHEMVALRMACASMEEGYLPPVTFVAVQKIQQMRLFPEVHGRLEMTDKSGNILPGTGVDLMICHPTEFDFYLCSHASIQLFIEFLNTTYSEQVPEGTTIGMLSLFFLKKINVILKDFYVESQSKVLSETEILSSTFKDRTIRICPRLRGGFQNFIDFIGFGLPNFVPLTTIIQLPLHSVGYHYLFKRYLYILSDRGRMILNLLLELLERLHNSGWTVNGQFNLQMIIYCENFGRLVFCPSTQFIPFREEGYILDMSTAGNIISSLFGWRQVDGTVSYPIHMGYMLNVIGTLVVGNSNGLTKRKRSFFFSNCCLMSQSEKVGLFLGFHLYSKQLTVTAKTPLGNTLGQNPQNWLARCSYSPMLYASLTHTFPNGRTKTYNRSYLSQLDHCRDFLYHLPANVAAETAESIIEAVYDDLLPYLQDKFTLVYVPHADAVHISVDNVLGTEKWNHPEPIKHAVPVV